MVNLMRGRRLIASAVGIIAATVAVAVARAWLQTRA
jgi:hypothetical protein